MFSTFSGSLRAGRVKPSTVVVSTNIRDLLSASGKTAYDAAGTDAWFSVSSTDYAAVLTGLAGTSSIGHTTAEVTGAVNAFVGTYGFTMPIANATVPANNYVIGLVTRGFQAAASTFRPYTSTTFKGTYTTLGNNIISAANTTNPVYFLRKTPTNQATTSYIALGPRNAGGGNWATAGTYANAGYSANMTSWTNWNTNAPIQQWLITTTAT